MTDGAMNDARLAVLLQGSMVEWTVLEERYGALLKLVDKLLGVVPNCDRYLEIWPPAFRSYNIMVPNLLNLPVPVLGIGGPRPSVVGLGMYVASRTAGCPYCSAHTCSFAMRRGATPEMVAAALFPDGKSLSRGEVATIAVARALAQIPSDLKVEEKSALIDTYGESPAEWIVLAMVMMGFLNKFMDSIGVELEQQVVDEVADAIGPGWDPGQAGADIDPASPRRPAPPIDGWRTRLGLVTLLPAAIRYDNAAQRGVPKSREAVSQFLTEAFGHDFPVLATLRSNRARRAMASMLRENLDPTTSVIGIETKLRAGAIFAHEVGDPTLEEDMSALARHARIDLAGSPNNQADSAALSLARAASPSPAMVGAETVDLAREAQLPAAAIIELVTWLAVLQMLHRLNCWAYPSGT